MMLGHSLVSVVDDDVSVRESLPCLQRGIPAMPLRRSRRRKSSSHPTP